VYSVLFRRPVISGIVYICWCSPQAHGKSAYLGSSPDDIHTRMTDDCSRCGCLYHHCHAFSSSYSRCVHGRREGDFADMSYSLSHLLVALLTPRTTATQDGKYPIAQSSQSHQASPRNIRNFHSNTFITCRPKTAIRTSPSYA